MILTSRGTLLLLFLGIWVGMLPAQKEDYVWFLGDSLLLDFNTEPPTVLPIARLWTWKNGTSICDSTGNLLFYMNHDSIFDANHEVIENGYEFGGRQHSEQGTWMIPGPGHSNRYYIFTIGVDCAGALPCFTYSVLENDNNPGLTQKNIKLANVVANKVAVTRHANGSDWWLVIHEVESTNFFIYLLTPNGISEPYLQSIGSVISSIDNSQIGEMTFSPQGDKLALVGLSGLVETYDFDRCTGELSNVNTISISGWWDRSFYGCAFSPSGEVLYATHSAYPQNNYSMLFQFDLNAPDIWAARDTVWTSIMDWDEADQLELGPNGMLYMTHTNALGNTAYDSINQFLSVILAPDSLGAACNVDAHSISLAPYKSTLALPNFPNFRLGPITLQPANAGPDLHTCPGTPVPIGTADTTGSLTYSWWPQDGLDDPNSPTPIAAPQVTTTYFLTVSDPSISASCNYTEDSVTVVVDFCHTPATGSLNPDLTKVVIPSIVTPNQDGKDDLFSIRWLPHSTEVAIFDAHGRRVFYTTDYQNNWPGTTAAAGVYFYRVQFPGEAVRVGKVMVLP